MSETGFRPMLFCYFKPRTPKIKNNSEMTMGKKSIIVFCCMVAACLMAASVYGETSVSGTISEDTTWTADNSPYIVTANTTVVGTDGDDAVTTLTIEPGVEVLFNGAYSITIGSSSGSPGALVAEGTSGSPILFSSNDSEPAAGDWRQINFYTTTDTTTTVLNYCIIQYGGYGGAGQVYVYNTSPTITNCTFSESSSYDISLVSG